ncbi:recombinase family protein [Rhizobium skierniewicense]|uniref:recombinase family protein n=1 Tax=Rhizobium skierniewicense TaxID=984260 RepID=UPI001573D789|nr:recombinase family protein [Rhizobium skierniewicense]NTF34267.1 recombinase family protein [Rhizobium skierniewicense]
MQPQQFVAYYRVSTQRQGESGLGLEAQRKAVADYTAAKGIVVAEFTEIESGGKFSRPQLNAALAHAKANNATLVIAKMDRLSRNAHLVSCLLESGVNFIACDNEHATPMLIRILAAVAQEEREQIGKRVKAALGAAKARGVKLGGVQPSLRAEIDTFDQRIHRHIQTLIQEGHGSATAIAKALNERAIESRKGGKWQAVQVQRLLKRIAEA